MTPTRLFPARPSWKSALAALLAAGGLVLPHGSTLAQSPTDRSTATALFKEGRTLMEAKRYAEACPKLAESYRLEPATGTLLNLGLCHEAEGKVATAWSELSAVVSAAKRDGRADRARLAQQHVSALEEVLPRLTIQVPAASRLDGLEIKRDGVAVNEPAWGSAIPVDPGSHLVEATAPGRKAWVRRIEVNEPGPSAEVTVPELEADTSAPPSSAPPQASSPPPPPLPPEPRASSGRAAGYVLTGFGVVGAGVGSFFGLRAISQRKDADSLCPNDRCTQEGYDRNESAKKSADISTIAFAASAVVVGVGVYLVLSSDPAPSSASSASSASAGSSAGLARRSLTLAPAAGPGSAGAFLSGRF